MKGYESTQPVAIERVRKVEGASIPSYSVTEPELAPIDLTNTSPTNYFWRNLRGYLFIYLFMLTDTSVATPTKRPRISMPNKVPPSSNLWWQTPRHLWANFGTGVTELPIRDSRSRMKPTLQPGLGTWALTLPDEDTKNSFSFFFILAQSLYLLLSPHLLHGVLPFLSLSMKQDTVCLCLAPPKQAHWPISW